MPHPINIMKTNVLLILLATAFQSCNSHLKISNQENNSLQSVLDSIYISNPECVGILAHVESPNQDVSWSGSIGYSNKVTKDKVKSNQPILIASNTKTFVAVAILRLVEDQKIDLYTSISHYLNEKTLSNFKKTNYNIDKIQVAHLLSHTSGINDYVDSPIFENKLINDKSYHWTRDEQIALALLEMEKLGNAGEVYKYSDTNYLLLTEILETVTGSEYFNAIRNLVNYKKINLNTTWFESMEDRPAHAGPLAHQYVSEYNIDSYDLGRSFDLYGGGGIASTTGDLSQFFYSLFNHQIFNNPKTLDLLLTRMDAINVPESDYRFGIWKYQINGQTVYGHGGFWGSIVYYLPEKDLSISVVVLEKDQSHLRKTIVESLLEAMNIK